MPSSVNLLFFMSVLLLVVDGLHELQLGTADGGQVTSIEVFEADERGSMRDYN